MAMLRRTLPAILLLLSSGAFAADIEPGEWEFNSVSTSQLFPKPQTASFKRCIRKEDAANPDRWMSQPDPQGECKLTPGKKDADTYTWSMECPKVNMRGTGSARMSRAVMDGETFMTGEVQGRKFELRTKVTGRRLGPCKG
ncbi:MAG TPA: DUF3617 family protein [Burkholderiales bacterium]|nr:DUF3617 family protein [Burkholderiales bacterium]